MTTKIKRIAFGPVRPDTRQKRCTVTIFREGPGDFVVESGVMRGDASGARLDRSDELASGLTEARKIAAKAVARLRKLPSCRVTAGAGGLGRARGGKRSRR